MYPLSQTSFLCMKSTNALLFAVVLRAFFFLKKKVYRTSGSKIIAKFIRNTEKFYNFVFANHELSIAFLKAIGNLCKDLKNTSDG